MQSKTLSGLFQCGRKNAEEHLSGDPQAQFKDWAIFLPGSFVAVRMQHVVSRSRACKGSEHEINSSLNSPIATLPKFSSMTKSSRREKGAGEAG